MCNCVNCVIVVYCVCVKSVNFNDVLVLLLTITFLCYNLMHLIGNCGSFY